MTALSLSIIFLAFSGIPGFILKSYGGLISAVAIIIGAIAGLMSIVGVFIDGELIINTFCMPFGVSGLLRLDCIGAFFLIPILILSTCASVFAIRYWDNRSNNANRLRLFFGITSACLVILVAAADIFTFLLAWEGMATAAFVLVISDDYKGDTRKAGWVYLIATHTGTLCLFAAFGLLSSMSGGYSFVPLQLGLVTTKVGSIMFVLFLLGFGLKAGIFPLHFWLPSAHASAPSHVSAFMSGILIKMGILGMIRIFSLIPDPQGWWGVFLIAIGAISGLFGVICALAQHDLKRLLAYHSIENIGIIMLGIGVGVLGISFGSPIMQLLGFAGGLLHILNHSLFKSLLFLGAGSVMHVTGNKMMEDMGGLSKIMPLTAITFLIGSLAICGLPPFNGFVSELFIYLAAFFGLSSICSNVFLIVVVSLTLIGALAVACFTKVFGVVFLGEPRLSKTIINAAEVPMVMKLPMIVLSGMCILIGIMPGVVIPVLNKIIIEIDYFHYTDTVNLCNFISASGISFVAMLLLGISFFLWLWCKSSLSLRFWVPTWDCGYICPGPRMQYTASSYAGVLVSGMRFLLWSKVCWRHLTSLLPDKQSYHSESLDIVLDCIARPSLNFATNRALWLRRLQNGHLSLYLIYMLLTVVVLSVIVWVIG